MRGISSRFMYMYTAISYFPFPPPLSPFHSSLLQPLAVFHRVKDTCNHYGNVVIIIRYICTQKLVK